MKIIPKVICKFSTISIIFPVAFFKEIDKLIIKIMGLLKGVRKVKTVEGIQSCVTHILISKLPQSNSNQNGVGLA